MQSANGNQQSSAMTSIVLGLGEIGAPLLEILGRVHRVEGIDIEPRAVSGPVEFMHVCYPAEIEDFVGITVNYAVTYDPSYIVIHSTVPVGTTQAVGTRVVQPVMHSPIRGKHARMVDDMMRYTKFIGCEDSEAGQRAADHFQAAGFQTKVLEASETSELAKLTETTYFGLLIAFAQDVDRMARRIGVSYDDVVSFYEEIGYLPPGKFFPGIIGGHCVMPNIALLKQTFSSALLDAVEWSNEQRMQADGRSGQANTTATEKVEV